MPRVALSTFGCKLNQAETAMLAEGFRQRGFEVVPFGEKADVVLINSCTVTGRTDYRCRQALRRVAREWPSAFTVVAGCYAELNAATLSGLRGVDLVLGADTKFDVFDHLDGLQKRSSTEVRFSGTSERKFMAPVPGYFSPRTRALLKIQDGCDSHCSYCAVPLARGRSRSAAPEDVVARADELAKREYKEIVLTGVHIGKYGCDLSGGWNLTRLLAHLLELVGDVRFRLSSLEPQEVDEGLLDTVLSSDRICRHFHVPLQSGSEAVLRAMNRSYTPTEFREKISLIAKRVPESGLGTDIIVGFPGETEADFDDTYRLVKSLPFTYLHVFRYSPRPGTVAGKLNDDVPPSIKTSRSTRLRGLGYEKKQSFTQRCVGQKFEVLFEQQNEMGTASGIASNYLRVQVRSAESLRNTLKSVRITGGLSKVEVEGLLQD